MVNKHFIKTVILFIGMLLIGLIGAFLVSHHDVAKRNSHTDKDVAREPCEVKAAKPC